MGENGGDGGGGGGMGGMNPEMIQQMMNNMGGSQAVNQNNPNSREGKQKERLRKKLAEKNSGAQNNSTQEKE